MAMANPINQDLSAVAAYAAFLLLNATADAVLSRSWTLFPYELISTPSFTCVKIAMHLLYASS